MLFSADIDYTQKNNCLNCHGGIEHIRDEQSGMAKAIAQKADEAGYPKNSCVVCHGGNPATRHLSKVHKGTIEYFLTHEGPKEFYPAPGSTWINKNTCGMCHQEQVQAQMNSLMMTEQGKIQGALWTFGRNKGYEHSVGNFVTKNSDDVHSRLGTDKYQKYMQELAVKEPQGFPKVMTELPQAPTAEEVEKDPSLAVYTYLRQECLRCHTGGKGRQKRGDFRGMGCASCHIPYSNSGLYEGDDKSIAKTPGHLLVHSIQSSRKVKVAVNGNEYSGIPVETCSTCHNRGKRIGVSYQGLMETEYQGTWAENGDAQPKLHAKRYIHMEADIHFSKGMLCQDCHTSNDMHGDGFLSGANLGAVEIECQDCHGTTKKYPWELPIGYGDEFDKALPKKGEPRGTSRVLQEYLKKGTTEEPKEGYLLSSRGNPLKHVVRVGDKVLLHLASGKDLELSPLKKLKKDKKLSANGLLAMDSIESHTDKMECYACHARWAPQCYGCHVKIDYSQGKQNPDFLAASHDHDLHGMTGDTKNLKDYLVDGQVTETRSYLRWEDPSLVKNGEGRVSPAVPGCQVTVSVIGKDGKALLQNHIYKIPNVEGAGKEGQNAINMAPIQPHTISKESRTCESCHSSPKALGLGIAGGLDVADPSQDTIVDLMSADGVVLPKNHDVQIPAIKNLKFDYSRFMDENGTQLQTVGEHWKLAGLLDKEQRDKLDRRGVCLSCHLSIPEGNLAVSTMVHIAKMANVKVDKKEHMAILNKILNLAAWIQISFGVLVGLFAAFIFYVLFLKKKPYTKRNGGWK